MNFTRKIAGIVIALGVLGIAGPASAASLTFTQVQAIVSLLQSFGADAGTVSNVEAALNGQRQSNNSCLTLSDNLYAGSTDSSTNNQVSQLQQFLGLNPTGYFGPMTLQAVESWQASHGVVTSGTADTTGYGFVGPQTRAAMEQGCGAASNPTTSTSNQTQYCPSGTAGTYPNCTATTPPITTTPATGGSCAVGNMTYQNGSTMLSICAPSSSAPCPVGLVASQWTCSNSQWVQAATPAPTINCPSGTAGTYPNCTATTPPATQTYYCPSGTAGTYPNCVTPPPSTVIIPTPTTTPATGGSCTANNTTYANGATLEAICNPSSSACAMGLLASQWTCSNSQWVQAR